MKLKHIMWCGLICTLTFGDIKAQEVMTLEKCRELALKNNNSIAIAERNKAKAEYTQKSYLANFFPKISASGNYLYTQAEMNKSLSVSYLPEMDLSLKLNGTWMAGLQARQPIFSGGKIASGYRISQIGNEISRLNQHLTQTDVIVKTDEAYWMYVQTNALLEVALSYQKVVNELLRNVQNAQEVGLKHTNDVLKVKVKLNEAELQVRQAENGVNLSRKNLCHIIGLPLTTSITLPKPFNDSFSIHFEHTEDYTKRPEYAILEQQVKLKEQQIKLTRSDFLPQIGIMANYGYINGLKMNDSKLLDNASFSVIASVSVPIFQWGEGRNKVRAAKTERDIMQLQRNDMMEMMELELSQALDKCNESMLEVELTSRSLQQAEENMRVSKDRYDVGMETLANYLESQTVWQQAWMEHINAQTRQQLNLTYYKKAVGLIRD
ncbi:TolC family protein [Bacteroides sp. 224]|uniref:TolC family protein n=1 Tax=Bacteroides sp. 224 TaxID=2302936 RepID=UPI0013D1D49F|nr:TolC family protein [Bacteroides sp. 224]